MILGILGDFELVNVPNNEEVPMTSGGLPLSKSQQERMAQENRKNNNDAFINRISDVMSMVPETARPFVAKAGGFFAGWRPDQISAAFDKIKDTHSSKPGKSTKSKPTASTGKKKK